MARGGLRLVLIAGFAWAAVPATCRAQGALAPLEQRLKDGPALADLVRYAYQSNPTVEAARKALEAAGGRTRTETANPDPALRLTWNTKGTDEYDAKKWGVMLSQSLPFPGKLSAIGRVQAGAEEIARLEHERTVREVLLQLRESYHEMLYIGEARRIASQTRDLLALLHRVGETAYARDRATLSDLLKAESQEAQVRYDELLLEELEHTERSRLNALLNRPVEAALGPLGVAPLEDLAFGREEILLMAASQREEVRIADAGLRQAQAAEDVATAEGLPEFMVGLGYESEASSVEDEPRMASYSFELGLTLPLWPGKNAGRRAAARAEMARAGSLKTAVMNEVRAQVQEVYFRLGNAHRLAELYGGTLLPQAAKAMELAETWSQQGAGSYADYVETVAVWYNFQLAQARARADYGKYLARLEALAGKKLTARTDGGSRAPGGNGAASCASTRTFPEPELYLSLAWPATAPESRPATNLAESRAWEAEKTRLAEAQRRWEASAAEEDFLKIDPDRHRALEAVAQDPVRTGQMLADGFSREDLEVLALRRSPQVKAAAAEFRASLEAFSQVANIDEIRRRYAAFTEELMTGVGAMGDQDSPAMIFPYPGIIALKGAVVNEAARASRAALEIARRDAVTEARRIYWEFVYLDRAIDVAERTAGLLASLEEAARSRYESGRVPLQDTLGARIEKERIRTDLTSLREERRNFVVRLRTLLDLTEVAIIGSLSLPPVPPPVFPAAEALFPVALAHRPELQRIRAQASRMQRMIEMAEKEILPQYSSALSLFADRAARETGTQRVEEPFAVTAPAGAGAGQPLRVWSGGEAAYLRETRAALDALRQQIRAEEQATVREVREGWYAVDRARRELELYRDRLGEISRLSAEVASRGYRAGTATFAEVLAATRTRFDVEREAARREADLGIAAAELEARLGTGRWADLRRTESPAGEPAAGEASMQPKGRDGAHDEP